jgi:beta-lactamase superfamily II metal-dependent hydrolase
METGAELRMSERQIPYQNKMIQGRIVDHLKSRGIHSLEDLI